MLITFLPCFIPDHLSRHRNVGGEGPAVKGHVSFRPLARKHPLGVLGAQALRLTVVHVQSRGPGHSVRQRGELPVRRLRVERPCHSPHAPAEPRVGTAGEEEESKVLLELSELRAVHRHTKELWSGLPLRGRLACGPKSHGALVLVKQSGHCIRHRLPLHEGPCVSLHVEDLLLRSTHSVVPSEGQVLDITVAQSHVRLRVLLHLSRALDGVGAGAPGRTWLLPTQLVGAPEVVDEKPVHELGAQSSESPNVLGEEPIADGVITMVPKILPAWVSSAVTVIHTRPVRVRCGGCWDLRGLLLIVIKHRALALVLSGTGGADEGGTVLRGVVLQKPSGVGGVVKLLTHSSEPRECLHKVAVHKHVGSGVHRLGHLSLCQQPLLTVHRLLCSPLCLGVRPIIRHDTERGPPGRGAPAAGVALHRQSRCSHVVGGRPRGWCRGEEVGGCEGRCCHKKHGPSLPPFSAPSRSSKKVQ
eukprot:Hpha_TRINITY_DN31431_c0_g1::TRINITY_DN31431_c0_g1_i1::g.145344::m.145344